MGGRKGAVDPTIVIDAVLLFKDQVIITKDNEEKSKYKLINYY